MDIDTLTIRARNRRRSLDAAQGQATSLALREKELSREIDALRETMLTMERVTGLLNSLGEERQFAAQHTIEELVTRGLQTIFEDTLSFHILQSVKNKRSEVEFVVRTTIGDYVADTSVMEARGGGLAATIGFLLRIVVLLLGKQPDQESVMVLDETFAHVSAEYLDALGEFLREIVTKTGVQIIMVTHQTEFEEYADKVIRFSSTDGKHTTATEIS